jgi:hypothetical protein
MTTPITKLVRLMIGTSVLTALFAPISALALDEPQSAPTVCLDKDGQIKKGEIDVLVLLDNSKSLKGDKSATDPEGKRFEALNEFLDSYSNLGSSKKNFGLISFAQVAQSVLKIKPITTSDVDVIKDTIKNKIGKPDGPTNYVSAFDAALKELKERPQENCKILIWFTDGGFNTSVKVSDGLLPENIEKDLADLERRFCGANGFVSSVQNMDVNTFVVFLGDGKDDSGQVRIDASIDVMQTITGDNSPSIKDSDPDKNESEICSQVFDPVGNHLGEVVSASEAKDLIGYLTDIVNIADGGKSVSKEDCPVQSETLESMPMPSGWFIDWVSVTSWDGDLPNADSLNLDIKLGGDVKSFSDYFDPIDDQDSTNVLRFALKEGKQGELKPGWIIESKELGRACLRAKPTDVKFRITGDQRTPINPALPDELFAGNALKCFLDGSETLCSSAAGEGLIGRIRIENGKLFSGDVNDETLPVSLEIGTTPSLLNDRCVIELVDDIQKSEETLKTSKCGVFPAPEGVDFTIEAGGVLNELLACEFGPWNVIVDNASTTQIPGGSKSVLIWLESDGVPENKELPCAVTNSSLSFVLSSSAESGVGSTSPIPVVIDFTLLKKSSPVFALILSALMAAIVSLLSLLLLRIVNMLTSKTVRSQDLFGYETSVDLVPGQFQRGELVFPGGSARSFMADIDQLQQVTGNQNQTSLKFASVNLVRRLPSFIRPFDESRLVLQSRAKAVFWKANRAGDGLNMAFSKAVILSTNDSQPPTADRPAKVVISVLVPKRGFGAGIEGVQQLVRERGEELAAALFIQMNSVQMDSSTKEVKSKSVPVEPSAPKVNDRQVPSAPAAEPMSRPANPPTGKSAPPQPPQPPRRDL